MSWLHGLGENGQTWDEMEELFDLEKMDITTGTTVSRGYNSTDGVLIAQGDATLRSGPSNIAIGHSMGGIVARAINDDPADPRVIGGIITVGTPNNGAAIANSLLNGDVATATDFACNSLLAGPLSEVPFASVIVQQITNNIVCNQLGEIVTPLLEGQSNQSAVDLAVGSQVITGLTDQNSGIPQVAIWGNERSPVHWRLVSSAASGNENDIEWVELAADFRAVYNGRFLNNTTLAVVTGIIGFWNPTIWSRTALHSYRAVQWSRGVRWFDTSEKQWNQLIDCSANRTESIVFYQSGEVNCLDFGFTGSPEWIDCVQEYCDPYPYCTQEPIAYSVIQVINGASDGFICEDSQKGSVADDDIFRADEANHAEEVIHVNVEENIRQVLGRPGSFFETN